MIIRPAQPVATQNKASLDRRAIFVSLSNESGEVDLLLAQRNERFGQLRTIYIDTSAQDDAGNGCVIETDIGQNITVLSGTQGYYTVFVPFVTKIKISANETATLLLLDFDVPPSQWSMRATSGIVPDPLHVIIDDQPVATNATVQNWPVSQPVIIDDQPIAVNATIQNLGLALGFTFVTGNGAFLLAIGPNPQPVNAICSLNIFGVNYTNTAGPQINFTMDGAQVPGRIALPFSGSAINGLLVSMDSLNLNVGVTKTSITANVSGSGTMGGQFLIAISYR